MIKPSDLRPVDALPENHKAYMALIEERVDLCLRHADAIGRWPAWIDPLPLEIADVTLEKAAELYRREGWIVAIPARGSSAMLIVDRPPAAAGGGEVTKPAG